MTTDEQRMIDALIAFRRHHDAVLRDKGIEIDSQFTWLRDQAVEVLLDHGVEFEVE